MPLVDDIFDRLDDEDSVGERVRDLVLAALTDSVASVLEGVEPKEPEHSRRVEKKSRGAWLRSIEVEGFRGIGRPASLQFTAGPGLNVVCGRNGSGKSSFSEALELLLTDTCSRWDGRSKSWRDAWQNLHAGGSTKIATEVSIDGVVGCARIEGVWEPGADPKDRNVDRIANVESLSSRDDLGWSGQFETWSPFLSYNELGNLLETGPAHLHDTLASVLGLEPVAEAIARLESTRKELRKLPKQASDELNVLRSRLGDIDDERAVLCLQALPEGKKWDLDSVEDLVTGTGPLPKGLDRLRTLATHRPVDKESVARCVESLREASADLAEARKDQDTSLALRVAELLDGATEWFDELSEETQDCPVCHTPQVLSRTWREEARKQSEQLRTGAQQVRNAEQKVKSARDLARRLVSPSLDLGSEDEELVGPTVAELRTCWKKFRDLPEDQDAVVWADHLERAGPTLLLAIEALRQEAERRRSEMADAWRPIAQLVAGWLEKARRARVAEQDGKDLKAAADWLSAVEEDLRNERFKPIKSQAQEIWELLRARSNVSLDDLRFAGSRTRRRLEMEVSVDGQPGVALGVMSQGELHSLALSLFLPRATLPESPFRFLLIDDPVQAMDPVKVEGLARVLGKVAETHQVVVFSHDDRLSEAVRRLGISAYIREVHRRPGSIVEVRRHLDPVSRLFADAHALVRDDQLPTAVRDRVVPGLCRQALEAKTQEIVRRRRIDRGEEHGQVEQLLSAARSFVSSLALSLFDDQDRGGDVYRELNRHAGTVGPRAVEVVKLCNKGSHVASTAVGIPFVEACQLLAEGLEKQS